MEAKLFTTSSIFICQDAIAAAALAELQLGVCACVSVYVTQGLFGCAATCLLLFMHDADRCLGV